MTHDVTLHPVEAALDAFVASYQAAYPELFEPYDPEWRSACERGEPERRPEGDQVVRWAPVLRRDAKLDDFAPLERALEHPIHPDIKRYYARYWSGGLEAEAADGHVSLILLWNEDDVVRLNENLIGHALAKRQAKSGFSVFFACTEPDSDLFLTVDNDSGAVLLEKPGYKPIRQVADDLASFLTTLQPAPPTQHPERMASVEF